MILSATYTDIPWQKSAPILYRGEMRECFSLIRGDGFEGVEMHIHDSDQMDVAAIKEALSPSGLTLTSIGTGSAYSHDGLSLTSGKEPLRQEAISRIQGHIRLASHFPGCVVILGLIRGKVADCPGRDLYDRLLQDSLSACTAYAATKGVTLVLEMINRLECDALTSIEEGISFLEEQKLPNLKLHIDTYHMNLEEANPPEAIIKAGSLIGHVHLSDDDRYYPGHGSYDFSTTLQALADISYEGALAIEALDLPDMHTAGQKTVRLLRSYLSPTHSKRGPVM